MQPLTHETKQISVWRMLENSVGTTDRSAIFRGISAILRLQGMGTNSRRDKEMFEFEDGIGGVNAMPILWKVLSHDG